ncbi:MAG: hypothetical protein ICV83_26875 [Cytophagales bacterium]|nr:hypothetical protein [Cytophagales bacterium]
MQKHILWLPVLLLAVLSAVSGCSESKADMAPNANNGVGGSMARFAIVDNYLYTVSNSTLKVFDISQAQQPRQMNSVKLGLNIETIFPYNNMLFIGSRTGMHIYDNANPTKPVFLSQYQHVQSCDPVVVQGDYAYVTLRDGTPCRFGQNMLEVVNISNPRSPNRVQSIPMLNPHGLGIDGNVLFVCEGDHGLKVFDATNPAQLVEKQFIKGIRTYDVIPHNQVMLVVGKDGLMQYDYSDANNPRLLSMIPLAN